MQQLGIKWSQLFSVLVVLLAACSEPYQPVADYADEPVLQAHGVNATKLQQAVDYALDESMSTHGVVILHNGEPLVEAYKSEAAANTPHLSYSVAKSWSSALVGIAIGEGLLNVNDRVCQFFSEWDCDDASDKRSRIQLHHLLSLTSGLEWHEDWSCPMTNAGLLFRDSDAVYMNLALFKTPSNYVLQRAGQYEPGENFKYSTGDPALLSRIIEQASGIPFYEYAKSRLFDPLGITEVSWARDDNGVVKNYSHLHLNTRDFAKLGQLFLQKGRWQGKQLVPQSWVEESTSAKGYNPWYAYLWHTNLPEKFHRPQTTIPADAFMARGIFGQWIAVIPSHNLVIAKNADDQCALDEAKFMEMVIEAVSS